MLKYIYCYLEKVYLFVKLSNIYDLILFKKKNIIVWNICICIFGRVWIGYFEIIKVSVCYKLRYFIFF